VGLSWMSWDIIEKVRRADQGFRGLTDAGGQNAVFTLWGMGNPQVSGHSDGWG
jgi:hypothetical protein